MLRSEPRIEEREHGEDACGLSKPRWANYWAMREAELAPAFCWAVLVRLAYAATLGRSQRKRSGLQVRVGQKPERMRGREEIRFFSFKHFQIHFQIFLN